MTDADRDPIIDAIARIAREPVAFAPAARDRLLACVSAEPLPRPFDPTLVGPPVFAGRRSWAARGLLAAGLIGVGVLIGTRIQMGRDGLMTGQPQVAGASSSQLPASSAAHTFVFAAPAAARVSVVG